MEKFWKKVAETAEITKTAPLTQRNCRKILQNSSPTTAKQPEKFWKKVAEITKIPKTAQKYSLLFIFTRCYIVP